MVQSRIDQLSQFQQSQARADEVRRHTDSLQTQGESKGIVEVVHVDEAPKHPADANGPKHMVMGVIRDVVCSYPAVMELRVEGAGRSIKLYTNDFSKIDLTVLGFDPK